MNFIQVQNEVDYNLNRAGLTTMAAQIVTWVRAEILHWEREALWPPRAGVGEPHKWSFLLNSWGFTCVAGLGVAGMRYTLPTDWWETVRVYTLQPGGTVPLRCPVMDFAHLWELYGNVTSQSQPSNHAIGPPFGGLKCFYLAPPPDQAYAGTMVYYRQLTELSGDSDTNIWTERYWPGIVEGATARGLAALRVHDEAQAWRQKAEGSLVRGIAEDRGVTLEEDMVLFISPDADAWRDNPRPLHTDDLDRDIG